MDKEAAVRSRVAVVRGVLSDADIAQLDALYAAIKGEALERSGGSEVFDHPNLVGLAASEHHTAFLHVERRIDRELPHIRDKVLAAMRDADAAHWSLLAPRPDGGGEAGRANIRVCEYHEYLPGGEVCDPRHCDGGSLVTMSVLLCQPEEFTGGTFTTLEADGSVTAFGDAEFGKTSTHSASLVWKRSGSKALGHRARGRAGVCVGEVALGGGRGERQPANARHGAVGAPAMRRRPRHLTGLGREPREPRALLTTAKQGKTARVREALRDPGAWVGPSMG